MCDCDKWLFSSSMLLYQSQAGKIEGKGDAYVSLHFNMKLKPWLEQVQKRCYMSKAVQRARLEMTDRWWPLHSETFNLHSRGWRFYCVWGGGDQVEWAPLNLHWETWICSKQALFKGIYTSVFILISVYCMCNIRYSWDFCRILLRPVHWKLACMGSGCWIIRSINI